MIKIGIIWNVFIFHYNFTFDLSRKRTIKNKIWIQHAKVLTFLALEES